MRKLLLIFFACALFAQAEGQQIINARPFHRAVATERTYLTVLTDGLTLGQYVSSYGITKDAADSVYVWADTLGAGPDFLASQSPDNKREPIWSADGVLFNGTTNVLTSELFTSVSQPVFIYIVMKSVNAVDQTTIICGTSSNCRFYFSSDAGALRMYSGSAGTQETDLAENTWGIVRALFNTTASTIQANESAAHTGFNVGANALGTIMQFGASGLTAAWSNIQVKELIIRKKVDTAADQVLIYNHLKSRYGL